MRFSALLLAAIFFVSTNGAATPSPLDISNSRHTAAALEMIRTVLGRPADKVDLAEAGMAFEKLVDPSINTDAMLGQIGRMAESVQIMAGPAASGDEKLAALRTYVYQPGPWNDFKPYSYDFTDLYGRDYTHALVSRYLTTRRGNCVSMPFLFIMLGDRLGLRVTASMAPRHVFVKYTDDAGKTVNLETTSGANSARDIWLRHVIPMSDKAVATGAYMAPLTRRETLAVMAGVILEADYAKSRYDETIAVADVLLQAYPKFIQALIFRSAAHERLIDAEFGSRYAAPDLIPPRLRGRYLSLAAQDRADLNKAEALGWRRSDYAPRAVQPPASETDLDLSK